MQLQEPCSNAAQLKTAGWKISFYQPCTGIKSNAESPTEIGWFCYFFDPFHVSGSVEMPSIFSTKEFSSLQKKPNPRGLTENLLAIVHLANTLTVLEYNGL